MEKFYIKKPHSFIDVITNSSTEIFMLDTKKTVSAIEEIIKEIEREYPPEYDFCGCGHSNGYATVEEAHEWEIKKSFGYFDEDKAVNFLKALGYTVDKKEDAHQFICIKAERGYMNEGLKDFINKTFKVFYHTIDG